MAIDKPDPKGQAFGATFAAFGIDGIPSCAVIDGAGRVAYRGQLTVTRGGGSGPNKMSKVKDDDSDNPFETGDDDGDKGAAKKGKSSKVVAGKSGDKETSAGKPSEVAWTNKITKMKKIPDEEITGTIDGIKFTLDKASLSGGRLLLQKTPGFRQIFSEAELDIVLWTKPNEDVSGKKYVVNGRAGAGAPQVTVQAMRKGDRLPNTQMHSDFCMILEFGDYDAELRVQPGKIYICLPDRAKSFLAGTFEASVE